jgi:ethanolaminephosphotransferase
MVASDHGMTDGGNHGGASYQEEDALALFISGSYPGDKRQVESVSKQRTDIATSSAWPSLQVDVVPTLALHSEKQCRSSTSSAFHLIVT